MMNQKCKYCEHFDPKCHKCEYEGNGCLTLGHESITYTMYTEVDQDEKDRRDSTYHLQKLERERKEKELKNDNTFWIAKGVSSIVFTIVTLAIGILITIYKFQHPELTQTQLTIYAINKYGLIEGIVFIVNLIVQYICIQYKYER